MTRRTLKLALACSLALNVGVLGALVYRAYEHAAPPQVALVEELALTPTQREAWESAEKRFLADLEADTTALKEHRTRLVREIFGPEPDPAMIEAQRQAIARLQQKQQQRVIAQLLAERELLDPAQRVRLAEIVLQQHPSRGAEELHRK